MPIDLTRICPLRYWHLTKQEQLAMLVTMAEANYNDWELYYGMFVRSGNDVLFVEPEEVH